MKKIILSLLALMSLSANAQTLEHNFNAGVGVFSFSEDGETTKGTMFKLGYGLNYYFSGQWSVMPGVAYREVDENLFGSSKDGSNEEHYKFIDVPVIAQYHIGNGKGSWTLGLGPVFSFCIENNSYYIDATPNDPRNSIEKCNSFSMGLQPSVAYQFAKNWRIGLEGHYNLTDMKNKDDNYLKGSRHLHHAGVFVNFLF